MLSRQGINWRYRQSLGSVLLRFIAAKQAEMKLKPAPEADRRTLIRRVTLDLTGLLPSPEEVEAFVRDPDPEAYEKRVDQMLASPFRFAVDEGR